jgi:hypothetical protein
MDVLAAEEDYIVSSCNEVPDARELADVRYVVIGQPAGRAGERHFQRALGDRPHGHDGADEQISVSAAVEAP